MVTRFSNASTYFISRTALLTALGVIMHSIESLLPPLIVGIPVRLGLANVFSLTALLMLGKLSCLLVTCLRCCISALIAGSLTSFMYSIAGGLLSFLIMALLGSKRLYKLISPVGISVAGAFAFNVGQLAVGIMILGSPMLLYFPLMSILSVPTGLFVGIISMLICERLSKYTDAEQKH